MICDLRSTGSLPRSNRPTFPLLDTAVAGTRTRKQKTKKDRSFLPSSWPCTSSLKQGTSKGRNTMAGRCAGTETWRWSADIFARDMICIKVGRICRVFVPTPVKWSSPLQLSEGKAVTKRDPDPGVSLTHTSRSSRLLQAGKRGASDGRSQVRFILDTCSVTKGSGGSPRGR